MTSLFKLTYLQVKLLLRIPVALFFNILFPLLLFFLYAGVFAGGKPEGVAYLLGPLITLTFVSNAIYGIGTQLVVLRERGALRHFHLAPAKPYQIIFSRILSSYLMYLILMPLILLIAVFFFHAPFRPSIVGLTVVLSTAYFAMAAVGMIIPSIVNSVEQAQICNQLVFFPLIFLSGATISLSVFPKFLQTVAAFLPSTLLVSLLQSMFSLGGGLSGHYLEVLFLFVIFLVGVLLSLKLFRWDHAHSIRPRDRAVALFVLVPFIFSGLWFQRHITIRKPNQMVRSDQRSLVGRTMDNFELTDQYGKTFRLSETNGPVMIVSVDMGSISELGPWINKIFADPQIQEVSRLPIIAIIDDVHTIPDSMRASAQQQFQAKDSAGGPRKPVLLDWNGNFASRYNVAPNVIGLYLVDAGKTIRYAHIGVMDDSNLREFFSVLGKL